MKRIVLAYSGGPVTSAAIAWLAQHHDAEVVTVTLDFGQERELAVVRERALALGAVRAHVIDAREEFVRDFVLPSLQAGALEGGGHAMVVSLTRPLIARRLVDMARMESASAVAHAGAPGTAGEAALHQVIRSLDPALEVIAPAREWALSEAELTAFARARNVHVPPPDEYRTDGSLWGRILSPLGAAPIPEDAFTLTRPALDCQDDGAVVDIDFAAGLPVRANGVEMSIMEMIESLDTIAGAHGVGRTTAGEQLVEAPAAAVLHLAHRELESFVTGDDLARMKSELARIYTRITADGRWFSDLREAIDAFVRVVQPRVTGSVRVRLVRGQSDVTECTSVHQARPSSLAPSTNPTAVA